MIIEAGNFWPYGILFILFLFLWMFLKKKKMTSIFATEVIVISSAILITHNLFPMTFGDNNMHPLQKAFINFLPFKNIWILLNNGRNGIISVEDSSFFIELLSLIIQSCILEFAVTVVISACIFRLTEKKAVSFIVSSLFVWTIITLKIIFYNNKILSLSQIYDTIEVFVVPVGAIAGVVSMNFTKMLRRKKENVGCYCN